MTAATHPVSEELMAHLDGELSADRAKFVAGHIEDCRECRVIEGMLRSTRQLLAEWKVRSAPSTLDKRVFAAITGAQRQSAWISGRRLSERPRWTWKRRVLTFAAAGFGFLLVLAISVPNLLRSRMAANEASAVGALRTLNTAAVAYLTTYGHFPRSLRNFGPSRDGKPSAEAADLIDEVLAEGHKSGYLFIYHSYAGFGASRAGAYAIQAEPEDPGKSGYRHFSTDQTGVIRFLGPNGEELDRSGSARDGAGAVRSEAESNAVTTAEAGPLIARRAELTIAVEKLDEARTGMDRLLTQHKGYVAELSASAETKSMHTLTASLRVPADRLDACISELKKLGRVTRELQTGEEVTKQYVDLAARLKNAQTTETRLNDVVQQRTGKVTDILEVEKESARVRGEIEQMEAEQKALEHRVEFATIDLKLSEEYKAQLSPPTPSVWTQLHNAGVNGFRNAFETLLGIVLFVVESGPSIVLWLAILGAPAWLLWRRYRRAHSSVGSLAGA